MSGTFQGIRGAANGLASLDSSTLVPVAQLPVVPVAKGGTNSSTALANNSVMVSSGDAIVELGPATDGQLVVGSTAGAPVLATLTGTANQVNIANGAGSITLSLPQSIATTSTPTFAQATISNSPVNATDAANKAYVDTTSQGLDFKNSCVAYAGANIVLSGTQTIDGVALVAGNRVLVNGQTSNVDNGIYIVAAGAWTRSTDFAAGSEQGGAFTFIESGTLFANTQWVDTSTGVVGTAPTTFIQFGGAGTYSAGTGLNLTGTTFSLVPSTSTTLGGVIVPAAGGLLVDGSGNITVPTATAATKGIASPDNVTITSTGGVFTAATATTSALGVVKPDGSTVTITSGTISVPTATTSALGLVQPDGTTIGISGGTITAATGSASQLGILQVGSNITVASGVISLPQSVATAATPSFASINLTNNSNQVVLGTTNTTTVTMAALTASRTVTLPDANSNTVIPANAPTNQFVTGISNGGVIAFAQPTQNSVAVSVAAKSANYAMSATDNKIVVTTDGITVSLPPVASVPVGQEYMVQLYNVATGIVTPDAGDTGVTLNGLSSFNLAPNYGSVVVYTPDNLQWLVS